MALGLLAVHALAQARYGLSPSGDQPAEIRVEYPDERTRRLGAGPPP